MPVSAVNPRPGLSFSHVGLFVTDISRMVAFYDGELDFTVTDRGELDTPGGRRQLAFLSRDPNEHHQLVLVSGRPAEVGFNVINQLSLRADSIATLKTLVARLHAFGIPDVQPVTHGNALSVYAPDPEGNRLELFVDLPWYVLQPLRVPVDLDQPQDRLMQWLEAHARKLPGFQPASEWRAAIEARMIARAAERAAERATERDQRP